MYHNNIFTYVSIATPAPMTDYYDFYRTSHNGSRSIYWAWGKVRTELIFTRRKKMEGQVNQLMWDFMKFNFHNNWIVDGVCFTPAFSISIPWQYIIWTLILQLWMYADFTKAICERQFMFIRKQSIDLCAGPNWLSKDTLVRSFERGLTFCIQLCHLFDLDD